MCNNVYFHFSVANCNVFKTVQQTDNIIVLNCLVVLLDRKCPLCHFKCIYHRPSKSFSFLNQKFKLRTISF